MKTIALVLFLFATSARFLYCEDWEVGMHTYHNVIVQDVQADRVLVSFDGGVAGPLLVNLSPELQKRFNYDPVKAKAATAAREKVYAQVDSEIRRQVAVTPPVQAASPTPVKQGLTLGQIAAIQNRIAWLQSDISEKQRQLDRDAADASRHRITATSAYASIVQADTQELNQLQAALK